MSARGVRRTARAGARAVLVAVLCLLTGAAPCGHGAAPPNVLIVVLDTLRADRTTLDGYARPTTPRLQELAGDAVVFTDAWSPASWTVPAHAGLLTGVSPFRLDLFRGLDPKLRDGTTLAERLGAAGFQTGLFSANPWVGPGTALSRGFGAVRQMLRDDAQFPPASEVLAETLAWIRSRPAAAPGRPWFAFANLMDVHAPYDPPPAESERFLRPGRTADDVAHARRLVSTTGLLDAAFGLRPLSPGVGAAVSDLYDGDLAAADAEVGRFLDALRADGTLDRTLVVVTSDHGEGLGDHGWREHGLHLHRELLRVPLVVRLPGRFDGGRRVDALARLEDVVPTALSACGLDPVPGLDGRDLARPSVPRTAFAAARPYAGWPWLAQADLPDAVRARLETHRWSAYDGRHHVILDDRGGAELYDLAVDPRELRSFARDDARTLERLRSEVRATFGADAAGR